MDHVAQPPELFTGHARGFERRRGEDVFVEDVLDVIAVAAGELLPEAPNREGERPMVEEPQQRREFAENVELVAGKRRR